MAPQSKHVSRMRAPVLRAKALELARADTHLERMLLGGEVLFGLPQPVQDLQAHRVRQCLEDFDRVHFRLISLYRD